MPLHEARRKLETHLRWRKDDGDNFISWTSSLLFALQRAIYANQCRDTNITICMIDTWKMGDKSFFHAETLLKIFLMQDEGKLRHKYYTAEFLLVEEVALSPGHNSCTVSFLELVRSGLYELVPHLRPQDNVAELCKAVSNIREHYFNTPTPLSKQDIEVANSLARSMCTSLALPFFTNLLSLQKRDPDDVLFIDGKDALSSE